ncbi:MAG: polysaccharide biosynthesis tyrosine autokinase [Bifidobacteriaceae bacterium]|jgi:capsular exopolysaccharide synthesis family protein|nr:polysaccharide biosynthesis tyrosine autokinase [Bifidobacteriaceae bacterium]
MELADYVAVAAARWRSILAVLLAGLLVAAWMVWRTPVEYKATTNVLLSPVSGETAGELTSGTTFAESQANSFAVIAVSQLVLEPAMKDLGLEGSAESFRGRVSARVLSKTTIIAVTVSAGTPEGAAEAADAVARQLVAAVGDMMPGGEQLVRARLVAPAMLPGAPSAPAWKRILALGAIIGLGCGYVQALIRAAIGRRVRVSKDVELVTSAPVIGMVRFDPDTGPVPVTLADPESRRSRDYRAAAANLRFLDFGGEKLAVVFTSAVAGEGKTTMVLNLGALLARAGAKTLLVDGDLRNPGLARGFGWDNSVGLTTAATGGASLDSAIRRTGQPGLDVLPAGPAPPDPAALLASPGMGKVFYELAERYDYVLVDSRSLSGHPDAALLVKLVGQAILVVRAGQTTLSQASRAVAAVEAVFGQVCGVMLNRVRQGSGSSELFPPPPGPLGDNAGR